MGTPQGPGVNPYVQLIPIALVFAIFYFIILLPTKRRQKKLQEFLNALKVGDRIVTNGGIHGSVTKVDGNTVQLQIADKVRIAYKGKALAPDIPVAYFLAAQAMTFWGTGILRALIMNLGAKSLLDVSLISSAEEHYARGMERYLAGDIEAARIAFESGIASDDYHAGSQLMLGIVNKVRGDWTQARKHFTVAEKLDPTGEHGAKAKEHLRQMSRRSDEPVSSDDGE